MNSRAVKEIKRLPFEVKNFVEENEFFTFEGYASTFGNVDLGDDIIVAGAFKASLEKNSEVPVLWQHKMAEPIGKSIQLFEDANGLYIKANLPKDDTLVSGRVIPQMKIGSIKEMSIGFFSIEDEVKEGFRYIKEIELFEVSLVTKAMNPQALVNAFKSMDSIKDVEQSLKELGLSRSEAKTLISKIKEFSLLRDAEEKQALCDAELKELIEKINEEQEIEKLKQLKQLFN